MGRRVLPSDAGPAIDFFFSGPEYSNQPLLWYKMHRSTFSPYGKGEASRTHLNQNIITSRLGNFWLTSQSSRPSQKSSQAKPANIFTSKPSQKVLAWPAWLVGNAASDAAQASQEVSEREGSRTGRFLRVRCPPVRNHLFPFQAPGYSGYEGPGSILCRVYKKSSVWLTFSLWAF